MIYNKITLTALIVVKVTIMITRKKISMIIMINMKMRMQNIKHKTT